MYILERIAFILDGIVPIMFLVSGIGMLISYISFYEDDDLENRFITLFFISLILLMGRIAIPYEINFLWIR